MWSKARAQEVSVFSGKGRLSTTAKAEAMAGRQDVLGKLNTDESVRALKDILSSLTLSSSVENFLQVVYVACMLSHFSHVPLFVTPWTVAHQAPLSMGFSRQEYYNGCRALLQEIYPTQGSNMHLPHFLHSQVGSLSLVTPGKPISIQIKLQNNKLIFFLSGILSSSYHGIP